jgi:hypothetical protein
MLPTNRQEKFSKNFNKLLKAECGIPAFQGPWKLLRGVIVATHEICSTNLIGCLRELNAGQGTGKAFFSGIDLEEGATAL